MPETGVRRSVWAGVLGWLVALAAVVIVLEGRRAPAPSVQTASAPSAESASPSEAAPTPPPIDRTPPKARGEEPVPYIDGLVWGDIDLREAQAVMPDNLYWQLGAPTKDPEVLAAREEEKKRRNEQYGMVLSGDANEQEVRAYYDYRTQLSTDFLEFAKWMQNRYGDKVNDEFRGLLDLSIKLHTARLAQIPGELADALERSLEREKIRKDWQREQEEFNDD